MGRTGFLVDSLLRCHMQMINQQNIEILELCQKTSGAANGKSISTKSEKGFSLVEVLVVLIIIGILLPVLHQIFMIPVYTQAKSLNFTKAELDASLYAMASSKNGELGEEVPDNCTVEVEDEELDVHSIECYVGFGRSKARAKANIFLQKVSLFSGDFQDLDEDGYEDTTGLPTHYNECYSGFKGNAGSSFKDASCELGGKYLIPMFKEIYSEPTLP